ncbi:Trimethylamine-N-oxide reductase 1 precursor [Slackia heliotrinireducens]|uniref:Anaerobic dehydrogenase, typically selenocysteine-containing n=1 Tax=Slackia heliotrinireducens (strain ATCC 29202 / DSM 20476 / NCTC 11029 / RHS 1) TaxID=471855 RepID=C7N1I9_SLAHD|nr:molybdopterin-dependent oxidoreductase [Slackia heliotrinireducens]ACV21281.1 anaerobic dehydrogenase, typically selenocysteine-containing [Slackia heliotrinireducens DSM 20476]VEG98716.1 Trimethylamine-N-oxide reductase 1 precursor [Slackia heliotrinireducens]
MSGEKTVNPGITRRGFMKGAAALGALGVTAGGIATATSSLAPTNAQAESEEHVAYTYHQSHCGNMCALACTVRDGRLVCIEPNSAMAERRYKTMCLKGVSEVQHIYSDKRIQTPLKRVGERGAGEFEAVSWEEALDDIVSQIKDIQQSFGKDSVLVTTCAECDVPFLATILEARTCANNNGIDIGTGNGLDPATGMGWGFAMSAQEPRDWVNSRLVLNVGNNFCESSLANARVMFDAKDAGAHVVTVDPHFSTTACKSDEWIPIEVGTDAALFLGMTTHILDNNLGDQEFMAKHTSLPFLIDTKTGMLVRSEEGIVDEAAKAEAEAAGTEYMPFYPFLVIDEDGQKKPYTEAANPQLTVEGTFDGQQLVSVYSKLCESQKAYPTSWAAEVTGISQERIEALAEEYAAGPSSLCVGWGGSDKLSNADITGHAAAVLVAVTGNIGKPGAGVGVYVGAQYAGYAAGFGEWAIPEKYGLMPGPADLQMRELRQTDIVHAIVAVGDLLAQKVGNMKLTEEWTKTIDLIVTADVYFTEGAKWADYVLPLTSRFEYDAEVGNVKNGYNHICLQEKVLDPLFEAKTDLWFQRELAKRLGYEDALPETADERVAAIMAGCTENVTLEQLKENQGVWPITGIENPRLVATDYAFYTESGNMEVYYQNLVDFNQALPQWEENIEAYPGNPEREKYPLQLTNTRTRFRIHNQFNDSAWLAQYYTPTVHVNPVDLEAQGIKTGDTVRLFNDRGEIKVAVAANEAIRPGSARLYEATTADYTVAGNMQDLTNDTPIERGAALMMGPVAPFSDTIVGIEKA